MEVDTSTNMGQEGCYYSDDFWMEILVHLDARSLCRIAQTCYSLYVLADDKLLWLALLQAQRGKVICVPRDTPHTPKEFFRRRKDFTNITDAVYSASSDGHDRIYISPGLYKEALVLDKSVDLIGEGAPGAVIIEGSTANTILSTAPDGTVSNVALRQTGHWFCVDVQKGSLRIEGCEITNATLSAIKVGKEGAPIISGNKIHDTHEAGVAVFGGSGVIENNDFYRNRYGSIEIVYSTANPIIRNNTIRNNRGYGIHVHTQSRPIIQGNTIFDNDSDGISCWGSADPYVTGNKILRNRGDGVYIHEDGKGTFENNEIYNQKLDGIRTSKSSPTLIDNTIHNNEGDGVRIVMGANPIVKHNRIYENNRVGIHVYREGCGLCMDNHIYSNRNAGMQVYGGGCTQVLRNKIQHNRCTGIYISDRASVTIQNNDISYNGDCGIEVVSGAHVPNLDGNHIHHNKVAGMALYHDTRHPLMERNNTIESNGMCACEEEGPRYDMMECDSDEAAQESMMMMMASSHSSSGPMMMDQHDAPHHSHFASASGAGYMGSSTNILMRKGKAVYPKATKSDHHAEVVSFLAEKAIQDKLCTFTYTREYYHAQYWYECRTCSSPRQILGRPEVSVCEQCAKACHVGHDLSPRKFGHFYCDCGQMAASGCKCMPAKGHSHAMTSSHHQPERSMSMASS